MVLFGLVASLRFHMDAGTTVLDTLYRRVPCLHATPGLQGLGWTRNAIEGEPCFVLDVKCRIED